MPIDYSQYPPNWKTEIRPAILERAGDCCEQCGVKNGDTGYRDKTGTFHHHFSLDETHWGPYKLIQIVLTVAHLDHDRTHNDYSNLAALCQRCHLNHDRLDNQHKRQVRKDKRCGQQQLLI